MRAAAINLRALPEQKDLIDRAASLQGKNRSDFMLEASCERAQAVLLDRTFFDLNDEQYNQFLTLLDAPIETDGDMKKLLSVVSPWENGQ
ncbi:DUF1778 domain-containing protein [Bacterioplanoides sp.]|uniref:type II toxin-antitoxin system TacA family antitoxin n=1 Tax=Bacterioplanoides sp. TaxID=2066072 RepID=UPI003B00A201